MNSTGMRALHVLSIIHLDLSLTWSRYNNPFNRNIGFHPKPVLVLYAVKSWSLEPNFGQRIVEKLNTVNTLSCHSLRSEASCVEVIDKDGIMTKDVALAIHGGNMKRELQNHAELRDPRAGGK
ncbi:hypothetical protein B0H16DRAFT_1741289 [Mycena metata]|uniref:Uncharacterized protein n=1 Tax=Mycena metata TaxID=1033252 RepID=A0AAD7MGC3_9AGAR|nr:hypothetical protein B0H16DRAFT_1741289 [Mycena metata]